MERRRRSLCTAVAVGVAVALVAAMPSRGEAAYMSPDYYKTTCPNLESIVRWEVARKINETVVTIPAVLRLFFHDCLVQTEECNTFEDSAMINLMNRACIREIVLIYDSVCTNCKLIPPSIDDSDSQIEQAESTAQNQHLLKRFHAKEDLKKFIGNSRCSLKLKEQTEQISEEPVETTATPIAHRSNLP
ncbi:hypothetical protein ABZP36_027955 [Zizania latifolia]